MRRLARALLAVALVGASLLLALVPADPARGQAPAETGPAAERLQSRVKAVEATPGIDEALRARLLDLYRQALDQLEAGRSARAAAAAYRSAVEGAPAEVEAIRERLARTEPARPVAADLGVSASTPVGQIEQRLAQERADLAGLEAELANLEKELTAQQGRPALARQELAGARTAVEQTKEEMNAPAAPAELPAAAEARRSLLEARLEARSAEVARLEQELATYAVRLELLGARRDQTARQVARARERVEPLEGLLGQARKAEVEQALQKAVRVEQAAAEKHPVIRRAAEANARSSAELAALVEKTAGLEAEAQSVEAQAKQAEQDLQGARQRLQAAGLSEALGRVLVAERVRMTAGSHGQLQRIRGALGAPRSEQEDLAAVGLAQVQVEEERRGLADLEAAVDERMAADVPVDLPGAEHASIRSELRRLLKDRQSTLQQLSAAQGAHLRAYAQLEFSRERLRSARQAYLDFLEEHLLWTPNVPPVGWQTVPQLVDAVARLLNPEGWVEVARVLVDEVAAHPVALVAAAFAFAGLLWAGVWVRRRQAGIAARVGKPLEDRFAFTVEGLVYAVLLALPIPLALGLLGWRLAASLESTAFARGVGTGLGWTVLTLLYVKAFLNLCAPNGVGALHFRWPDAALRLVRRQLRLLATVGVPAIFVGGVLGVYGNAPHMASLGRAAFITFMVVVALVLQRLLRPEGAVMRAYFADHPSGWLHRLRHVWYPLALGMPIALALLAAAGYFYSAGVLALRLLDTGWLVAGAVVAQALVVRWLLVARRRVALTLALQRREAGQDTRGTGAEAVPAQEEPALNLAAIDTQTRALLRAVILVVAPLGLWLIWQEVLPALNLLERVTLWHHEQVVDGQTRLAPVNLEQLLFALIVGVGFTVLARNLPGILQFWVLRHTALEAGTQYAVRKVLSYTLVGVGIVVVFGALGWSWSNIQWLVAALGVGLGFGLQEIFANFISGLIILFERPVRVGDAVTVGDLTGTVSRIRIRATTITDWDRKEIIVPNKAFITERVVNWTLTDTITRVKVSVGVAYGSDPELAQRVITEAVKGVPLVRQDPEPRVFFMGFGDSALNFSIYAFASSLADRLPMTHDLHMAIERALREHGIQIPFPQREVHIRAMPPGAPGAAPAPGRG
jgi:potassium efflux system protein